MLLQSLRTRRRTVAQTMFAAFVVTWFSVLCQQCLAFARDGQAIPDGSGHSAHRLAPPSTGTTPVTDQPSCLSECDCSVMATAATVIPPKSFLFPGAPDSPAALPVPVKHEFFPVTGIHVALTRSPDGVTPPLLERFCIRLE